MKLPIFLFHWLFLWPFLMLSFWPCKQLQCKDSENNKTLILQKPRVYRDCAGSHAARRSLVFLSVHSRAEGREAAETGPMLRGWVVARTNHPLCRFGSLLSSVILDKASGSCFVIPSEKTHTIKHVPMSLQFLNLLFKSPLHYHCISLIVDFQQRLTCNRRSNCAFGFRDCSFTAGNSRRIW